jgi:tetratricopeptide (TPR) repeat protein
LIANPDNRGFPAAVNQGLRVARGQQVLLLNNDTLVTTGWLRRLLDVLHGDPKIGLVGPVSNNVSGPQQIPVDYDDLAQLDGFAWSRSQRLGGQWNDVDRLVGFCLLIDRELIDAIGLFDERFGVGCYEDDDYCRRALQAGYRAVIATGAFVHHFGSRTFRASGVDLAGILKENEGKYRQKWADGATGADGDRQSPSPAVRSQFRLDEAATGGLLLQRHTGANPATDTDPSSFSRQPSAVESAVRLSLCMIVRDNEQTIRPCLESIRPWVDEMIVVDTGSKDKTPNIARELGARLYEFPWCDDFSAARNESLQPARGEWIFWMDSDDTIDELNGRKLRDLASGDHPPHLFGYVMQVHCPGAVDREHDVTIVDHVKLFRNRPDLRFEHRIHEQIIPAIRRAGGEVAFTDIYVVHSGSDHTVEGKARKLQRDLRILQKDHDDRPEHPFVLFNLGMTYADIQDSDRAVDFLQRCLKVSDSAESHVRKTYALLVGTLHQSGQHDDAWETCRRGLELFPEDKELLFRAGILHHHQGRLEEAVAAYRHALTGDTERHFASVDAGITGFKARHNLALVYEEMDRPDKAEQQWRLAVAERPHYLAGWLGLGETLLKQQRFDETDELARRLKACPETRGSGAVLAARLFEQRNDAEAARRELESVLDEIDGDPQPLRELSRLLFERFNPAEALDVLLRLAAADPQDASVQHNLATAYEQHSQLDEAVTALQRSLELRPNSPDTALQLASLLCRLARLDEAREVLQAALDLSPGHPELLSACEQLES